MIQELAVVATNIQQAKQRISAFRQRFGDGHFYLACHAALPIVLTPDFLYRLWASFQKDTKGNLLDIPWIAVSDLLLSNLYENVGYELYEMDMIIQNELLSQLQKNDRFGEQRVREIADFVIAYVEHELEHSDIDIRNLAQTQKLRALAYKEPHKAAYDIALMLTQLSFKDKTEWLRMATLLNSLADPLAVVQPLLDYIRAMSNFTRGNLEAAIAQMNYAVDADRQVRIEGINLPIPDVINAKLTKLIKSDVLPIRPRKKFRFAIAGGAIAFTGIMIMANVLLPKNILNIGQGSGSTIQVNTPSSPMSECKDSGAPTSNYTDVIYVASKTEKPTARFYLTRSTSRSIVCNITKNSGELKLNYGIPDNSSIRRVVLKVYLDGNLQKSINIGRGEKIRETINITNKLAYKLDYYMVEINSIGDWIYILSD